MSRAPAVADVMGGIGEDCGALVLTGTLSFSYFTAAWPTADPVLRVLRCESTEASADDFAVPLAELAGSAGGTDGHDTLVARCREADADWALPTCLAVRMVLNRSLLSTSDGGLSILVHDDWPAPADLGRPTVQASACVHALCKLSDRDIDVGTQALLASDAVAPVTGGATIRIALTALAGTDAGSLLQIQFHPRVSFETLEMPAGVMVAGARTSLERPTTPKRLLDTRICAEMGRQMIVELQRIDGASGDPTEGRLAAVTPTEYVKRFRDRLPTKISGKAFTGRFGALRGLNGELDPAVIYKIRSRSEHHIYENRRVHEFAASIGRARRSGDSASLIRAGELMYASHWSHSQRCGIGGVETDHVVSAVRARGPKAGLFGAKVTGGGAGGEVVVLMRDDEAARQALAEAVVQAQAASGRTIETYLGSLPGAVHFDPPVLQGTGTAETTPTAN